MPAAFKEGTNEQLRWQPARPSDHLGRANWWNAFGDPELDRLLAQVNVSNQTLIAAEAQFRQASALADQARAAWFPTLTFGLQETRSRPSATTGPIIGATTSKRTIYSAPLPSPSEPAPCARLRPPAPAGPSHAPARGVPRQPARPCPFARRCACFGRPLCR